MLEEYQDTQGKLREKIRQTREVIATATGTERLAQRERLRLLQGMLQDVSDSIKRQQRPAHPTPPPRTIRTDACTWDFFERGNVCWSDIEGTTWAQLQALASQGGGQSSALQQLMARATATLPETQRRRMGQYFGAGLTMQVMAEADGVARSSISRTLRRGLQRVEQYVFARLFLQDCLVGGRFDYIKFAQNTSILTDRQLELLYIALSTHATYCHIAQRLQLSRSTVCRTLSLASARLAQVSEGLERTTATTVEPAGEEKNVAETLGLPPVFYYRFLRRGELVGEIPRYHYELLRLRDAGHTAARAAALVGASQGTVARYWRLYRTVDISCLPPPTDTYRPAERFVAAQQFDLRRALAAYCKGEMGGAYAGA